MANLLKIFNESMVSAIAEKQGLKYIGFGRWISKNKSLYKSDGKKLVPFTRKQDRLTYFNNVKSLITNEDFLEIGKLMSFNNIEYNEVFTYQDMDNFIKDLDLTAPDLIFTFVPKKVYKYKHLIVDCEISNKKFIFTATSDSEFGIKLTLVKRGKSYICYINSLLLPSYLAETIYMRHLMYNIVNFFNTFGVTNIIVKCGLLKGSYMWAKFGFNFINSQSRIEVFEQFKKRLKDFELVYAVDPYMPALIKKAVARLNKCKNTWDILKVAISLNSKSVTNLKNNIPIDDYLINNIFLIGKFLLADMEYYGNLELYPDSPEYTQYYDYINYVNAKYNTLNESFTLNKDAIDIIETMRSSPFNISKKDDDLWIYNEHDRVYEKQHLEIVNE